MRSYLRFCTVLVLVMSLLIACTPASVPNEDTTAGTMGADTSALDMTGEEIPPKENDTTLPTEETTNPSEPPAIPEDAIDVTVDWGVQSGEGHGRENALILLEQLTALENGSTVYFPEGRYELLFPMILVGKSDVRIVGNRATLVRTGLNNTEPAVAPLTDPAIPDEYRYITASSGFIGMLSNRNITVEGLTFAYDIPTSLSGKVLSVNGGSAEIEITDGSPITGGEYATVINTFTADGTPDRTLEQYAESHFVVEKLSESIIRVSGLDVGGASNLKKGTRVCLRLCTARDYLIIAQQTSGLTFRNLNLQKSFNGGILLAERCGDATLSGIRVQSPNADDLMSLNADALHIADMMGSLTVDGCTFDRPGDDCINVHSGAYLVESVQGGTLQMASPRFGSSPIWALPGDTLAFYDPATFALVAKAQVKAVDGKSYTLESTPSGIRTGLIVSNEATRPVVDIRNSTVQNTRARGLLLQTDRVTVSGCTFRGTALAAILIAPDVANWYEMSPVLSLRIENNRFEGCGHHAAGVIQITASHDDPAKVYPSHLHGNVTVQQNIFSSLGSPAVYALSSQSLTVRQNTVDGQGYRGHWLVADTVETLTVDTALSERTNYKNVGSLRIDG